ncbi:MAG: carbohydrate-binding protein [Elusimicrobia bacterium]|nr:carbohydrate-binding protein [Elusimicrobiota bacterium]
MRNWIFLGLVFGMCLSCIGQAEAKKKIISKKSNAKTSETTDIKKQSSGTDIKIEAEDFDKGGEGVGYHETDAINSGKQYRTTEGVDIQVCNDIGGGFNVGWVRVGEWLKYTINIETAGKYTIEVRVSCDGQGGKFHIEFDDVDKTGPMTVPDTGGWATWQTVTKTGVSLDAGKHVMKLSMDAIGAKFIGNFNYINLKLEGK